MTDTEKQALERHLAEVVCGFERDEFWRAHGYCIVDGRVFSPLTGANDCSLVMEAWQSRDGVLDVYINRAGASCTARTITRARSATGESWPEAVCLAIARASGWEK